MSTAKKTGLVTYGFFLVALSILSFITLHRDNTAVRFSSLEIQKSPVAPISAKQRQRPFFKKDFVCNPCGVARVHAATLSVVSRTGLRAFWWGGTKEGSRDVSIFTSHNEAEKGWNKPRRILDVYEASGRLHRYTKKLGNVSSIVDGDGRIWLFFVSVSAGGWSGSSVNFTRSDDDGRTWSAPRKLVTSPFFNVSTAVRSKPVLFEDGSIGVPVYHEFAGKFSELLRIDKDGAVKGKHRITWGRHTLQPGLIVDSPSEALALHRQSGATERKIVSSRTSDAGLHWNTIQAIDLPNPDASIAALRARDGKYLLAFNNREHGRNNLALATSTDKGGSWTVIANIENSQVEDDEFSYPTIVQASDGMFHMVYTWKRIGIAHAQFSPAWVSRKLARAKRKKGVGK